MRPLSSNELLSVEENLVIYSVQEHEKNHVKLEYAFLSYEDYANNVQSFESRVQFVEVAENKENFQGIVFPVAVGRMLIFPDLNIEKGSVALFGTTVKPPSLYKLIKNNNKIKEIE